MNNYKFLKKLSIYSTPLALVYFGIHLLHIIHIFDLIDFYGFILEIFSSLFVFILILGIGQLIKILLDIRENQIVEFKSKDLFDDKQGNINLSLKDLIELKNLIHTKDISISANRKDEIIAMISKIGVSKNSSLYLINKYSDLFGLDLISDLKGLSNNFETINEYLSIFIEQEIVENKYPHEII